MTNPNPSPREVVQEYQRLTSAMVGDMRSLAVQIREEINRLDKLTQSTRRTPKRERPRCGARTRDGQTCQAPALSCGRCRMHGGANSHDDVLVQRLVIARRRRELLHLLKIAETLAR